MRARPLPGAEAQVRVVKACSGQVWYDRQGPAREVLLYGELPMHQPGPGEVRARLHASAANPSDTNRRAGRMHLMLFELYSVPLGLHHDARFLHLPDAVSLTWSALEK
jgi:hypothetical protein